LIPSIQAARAIDFHRKDALVVATSAALRDWNQVSQRRDLDVDLTDCMDRAPAVGLGLSLARPDRKVLVLDCDATLRTDLAGLATIGESRPENFVHFVFEDAAFTSTDGVAIRGMENLDFAAIARASGYATTYEFDSLEDLLIGLEEAMVQEGPVFVVVKVVRDEDLPPFPARSMSEGWAQVRESLAAGS
jgi:phosphonopyruvate decarboxylase